MGQRTAGMEGVVFQAFVPCQPADQEQNLHSTRARTNLLRLRSVDPSGRMFGCASAQIPTLMSEALPRRLNCVMARPSYGNVIRRCELIEVHVLGIMAPERSQAVHEVHEDEKETWNSTDHPALINITCRVRQHWCGNVPHTMFPSTTTICEGSVSNRLGEHRSSHTSAWAQCGSKAHTEM